jgi:hypothetical protein
LSSQKKSMRVWTSRCSCLFQRSSSASFSMANCRETNSVTWQKQTQRGDTWLVPGTRAAVLSRVSGEGRHTAKRLPSAKGKEDNLNQTPGKQGVPLHNTPKPQNR